MASLKVRSTTGRSTGTLIPTAQNGLQSPEQLNLIKHIGAGHSGEVLLAQTPRGDELVMKVARRGEPALRMKKLAREFERELKTAIELEKIHPAFVRMHLAGELQMGRAKLPAAVMEKVEGESLAPRKTRSRPCKPRVALALTAKLAEILAALEKAGYRHNDLHTENLLAVDDDPATLRIIDLGRVSKLDAPTKASRIVFAAPERRMGGGTTGVASDIYTVGVVLFTLLNGGPPALKSKRKGVDEAQLQRVLERSGASEAVGAALRGALATKPADRFASFSDFQRALEGAV